MELNNEEMYQITGGGSASFWTTVGFIAGIISFTIGVIDGFFHPKKCN